MSEGRGESFHVPDEERKGGLTVHQLTNTDLHFIVSRLPKDIVKLAKEHDLIIAGGFIRETISGGKVSDIDIFGESQDKLKLAALMLAQERKGRMFETKNAITVLSPPRFPVQFISRWLFKSSADCVASFDFTVCQAAVWFSDDRWHSAIGENFYPDLAARRLVYTFLVRDEEAGGSMIRMKKFIQRGYSIQTSSLAGVVSRLIGKIDRDKINIRDEKEVARVLTGFLREVDPNTVVDGIDLIDEHEIKEIPIQSTEEV